MTEGECVRLKRESKREYEKVRERESEIVKEDDKE